LTSRFTEIGNLPNPLKPPQITPPDFTPPLYNVCGWPREEMASAAL